MKRSATRTVEHRVGFVVVALALVFSPALAAAQLFTNAAGSILFFPLVAADSADDTLIQVANTSNSLVYAQCFYLAPAQGNLQVTDFLINLTKQQPTQWVASRGRPFDPADGRCSAEVSDCAGAGFDPGSRFSTEPFQPPVAAPVPPAPLGFRGALLCVQVSEDGAPFGANSLVGQATLLGDVARGTFTYEAIASPGNPDLAQSEPFNELRLENTPVFDGEFNACPQAFFLNHLAANAPDPLLGSGSTVNTRITAMPCSIDLLVGQTPSVTLDFQVTTDLEDTFSASTTVQSWLDADLIDIAPFFDVGSLGSSVARTRVTASPGGAVIVGNETRSNGSQMARTGVLLDQDNEQRNDVIILPAP